MDNKILKFIEAQVDAEKKGKEEFTCPVCGGHAWWGRSVFNNHLHCGCVDCGIKIME